MSKTAPDPRYAITPEMIKAIEAALAKGKSVTIAPNKESSVSVLINTVKRIVFFADTGVRQ